MKRIRIQKRRTKRATLLLVAGAVTSLLLPAAGAWAYDYDYPVDDPIDCQMYGGWDFGPGMYCEEDTDWVANDTAYVENVISDTTPSPQPSASPSPSATPTPSPSSPPNGNGNGKGPKK